jgi:hypothetical protein
MKHLLNDLSDEEKNNIREQHTGGKKIVIENFNKLVNTKLGDAKPFLNEDKNNPKEKDPCEAGQYVLPGQNYVVGESKVKEYMKSKNIKTTNKTFDFVGCTPEILREHLENSFDSKMTWENYGKWEIDHKIPLSQGTTVDELYKLNYFRNLQPMWKHENIKKGAQLNY